MKPVRWLQPRKADRAKDLLLRVAYSALSPPLHAACCIVPLTLIVFGVSGAWMANLRAIAPYQPILIVMTIAVLGYGFYLVY
jgi:mercuric ion transport protein